MEKEMILLVGSSYGTYIPQFFAESFERKVTTTMRGFYVSYVSNMFELRGCDDSTIDSLLSGSDHEDYFGEWDHVLSKCYLVHRQSKQRYYPVQNEHGDLWAVPAGSVYEDYVE